VALVELRRQSGCLRSRLRFRMAQCALGGHIAAASDPTAREAELDPEQQAAVDAEAERLSRRWVWGLGLGLQRVTLGGRAL
jgi:hypothetical protein